MKRMCTCRSVLMLWASWLDRSMFWTTDWTNSDRSFHFSCLQQSVIPSDSFPRRPIGWFSADLDATRHWKEYRPVSFNWYDTHTHTHTHLVATPIGSGRLLMMAILMWWQHCSGRRRKKEVLCMLTSIWTRCAIDTRIRRSIVDGVSLLF